MWAKSDKRQVCAFCSIGGNHTTYLGWTQSNCSDFGSTASLFSCKILKYKSIILPFNQVYTFCPYCFVFDAFSLTVCLLPSLCSGRLWNIMFLFPFPNFVCQFYTVQCPSISQSIMSLFDHHIFYLSFFQSSIFYTRVIFLGLYPLVLEAMIWTQWPWRDKPISWLISSVCFS